ncbi:MAG: trifunctional transcriptional activator/DNA repair protein Ada/methylated-DNA--[protein]-cysteine S-methyltransferase [Gammaproteobacteria bacterium]|jgi:AraC family transcriptional regulator of adaptative response/methylated-DNA-[protein]-cysteine methyltransferase|nr:trifunctional transcriptional activator/DNA repair protein Ada/methylated-DNA--[protein]-cysteine S-methyltransferase [Gammaproteobacteria bacterium]
MLFTLPDNECLYQALLKRATRFDGQVFVCVESTGVFCRLSCPARKPKPENCHFVDSVQACLETGYRPCKRCRPLQQMAQAEPLVQQLLDALERRPEQRWSEANIIELGLDVTTVRRAFKRQFGMTFLELARLRRLREGFATLAEGSSVIDAQQQAGYASASAFRLAFARLLGCAPCSLKPDALLLADWISTPLGDMIAVSSASHLHLLEFVGRRALQTELRRLQTQVKGNLGIGLHPPTRQVRGELQHYFSGSSACFATPLAMHGSVFAQTVWQELMRIPPGTTCSYGDVAKRIDQPTATRAVARANGANQIAIVIPCHRVIGADGSLTGYGGGLWRKQRLLEIEQHYA